MRTPTYVSVMLTITLDLVASACDSSSSGLSQAEFASSMAQKMREIVEECSPLPDDAVSSCQDELSTAWSEYTERDACEYSSAGAQACYDAVSDDDCDELYDDAAAALLGTDAVWLVCDGYAVCPGDYEDE